MSHDYHEGQPNFSPAQILKDGCAECAERSKAPWTAILHLDPFWFAAAWQRAAEFERGELDDVCAAEVPVLRTLWAVQVKFSERGIPIGRCPDVWDSQREVALP